MPPLVTLTDLHKSYVHMGRRLHVLRGINLTIDQGEVVAALERPEPVAKQESTPLISQTGARGNTATS